MRWCRTSCRQARRWTLRLQSREAAVGLNSPGVDATADFHGAALPSHCHSIDTARATDRDDNCECWRHTPRAGCHRLLGVAHAGAASGKPGNAACHRAGEQSLGRRSGQLSRASPPEGKHSPRREPCAVTEAGWQEQIQWYAPGQDEADAPVPGAGSRPIARPPAITPAPRPSESTSDLGLARHPRLKAEAQRRRDADTARPHRRR